jgi:hypothetical protein
MFITVAFCKAVILLALLVKPEAPVAGIAITMAFGTITTVLGCYVFGAVWDDKRSK